MGFVNKCYRQSRDTGNIGYRRHMMITKKKKPNKTTTEHGKVKR
jgi:hypothetical protein